MSRQAENCLTQFMSRLQAENCHVFRLKTGEETAAELTETTEIRKAVYLAVGKACKATFWPTPALTERNLDISGISSEETQYFCVHGIPKSGSTGKPGLTSGRCVWLRVFNIFAIYRSRKKNTDVSLYGTVSSHTHTHTHTHTHKHTHTHSRTHAHTHTHTYTHTHTHTHAHTHTRTHIHTYTYNHTYKSTPHTHTLTHTYIHTHIYTHPHIHPPHTHKHTHTHQPTHHTPTSIHTGGRVLAIQYREIMAWEIRYSNSN